MGEAGPPTQPSTLEAPQALPSPYVDTWPHMAMYDTIKETRISEIIRINRWYLCPNCNYVFPDIILYLEESPGPWLSGVIEHFFRTFSPSFTRNHTVFRPRTTRRPCDPSPFSQTHSKIHLGITFHLPHQPSPSFRFHHTPTHARRSPTTSVINTK